MVTDKNRNRALFLRTKYGAGNEKGFALLGLVFISTLFFSAFLFFAFFTDILQDDLKLKKNCIQINWQYQESQKKNLEKLLKLNPRALELRKRWILAQQRMAKAVSTANPYAIAAAKAYMLSVYYQKTQHAARQQSVLLKAQYELQLLNTQLRSRIQSRNISAAPYGLAVEPESAIEVASPYRTVDFFSTVQMSGAEWKNSTRSLVLPLIQKLVASMAPLNKALDKNISGKCYVTIERRNLKWYVTLAAKS
ncbi:MAG: hypothetical protein AABZ31_05600 [Bdellovibrionota bacterium]